MSLLRTFSETSGTGASFSTGTISSVSWVTSPLAGAIASEMVDDERLPNDEAEVRYLYFYRPAVFTVIISITGLGANRYSVDRPGGPFAPNAVFLQHKDNPKEFSRGEITPPDSFAFKINGSAVNNAYMVRFSKTSESGKPLIGDAPPKMQVQYTVGTKKVVLDLEPAKWIKDKKIAGVADL